MSAARTAATSLLAARAAYGVGLAVAPAAFGGRRWLGDAVDSDPVKVALRGLGVREAALHAGLAVVAARGGTLAPWLAASAAGDAADLTSTVLGRNGLPDGIAPLLAAVAVASAVATIALGLAADAD